jgi:hypothetical protein
VYEKECVTVLWNQAAHTGREVTAHRQIRSFKKRESMYTDRCGNTRGEKSRATGNGKEAKIQQQFIHRYTKCMIIPVIIGATGTVRKGLMNIEKPYRENIQFTHYE